MAKHTIQQILQQHGARLILTLRLPLIYLKVLDKLGACRTAILGGHAQYCANGHLSGIWYNSCKHRSCPQCQGKATEEWLMNTKEVLLDCAHHHIIFTIPHELNDAWRHNQLVMTDILFKASQQTLQQFSKDPKYLNGTLGIICALHTWGRNLSLHPHIHALVSHGGINSAGEWIVPKKGSLFPQKPVMMVFRGKFLSLVKQAMKEENWKTPSSYRESQLSNLLNKLGRKKWNVHFCKRYDYAEGVAKYLSRYVKSGPLNNKQIRSVTDDHVTFEYRSHHTQKTETLTLSIEDFILRLLQHAPLPGRPTVRYCGIYHSAARKKLNIARIALGQKEVSQRKILKWQEFLEAKGHLPVCETCGLPFTVRVPVMPVRKKAA